MHVLSDEHFKNIKDEDAYLVDLKMPVVGEGQLEAGMVTGLDSDDVRSVVRPKEQGH